MQQKSSRQRQAHSGSGTRASGRGIDPNDPNDPSDPKAPKDPVNPFERAIGLLARRSHSQWELRRKLRLKGYAPVAIDDAMARLGELGYLNDPAFAAELVRRRAAERGPMALSRELASKGIARAEVDAALAEFDPEAQLAAATKLVERLYARTPGIGYRQMLDSIGAKLLRRGFSTTIVRTACRSVLMETAHGADD